VHLNPAFADNLARFVASQGGAESVSAGSSSPQTSFQMQPIPTPGLIEYTVEIDGQILRYRNGRQDWAAFAWPSQKGQPGAKITGVTTDGRTVEIVNFPGQFGLEKLINSAQRNKRDNDLFSMSWTRDDIKVSVNFRLISDARAAGVSTATSAGAGNGLRGLTLPATVAGTAS
jgi:type VI secretion system protein ImpL